MKLTVAQLNEIEGHWGSANGTALDENVAYWYRKDVPLLLNYIYELRDNWERIMGVIGETHEL